MIRNQQAHYPVSAHSDAGRSGKINEDRYAVSAFTLEGRKATPVLLAVLSDGIGGHRAGEVAAEMAVNAISERVGASNGKQPTQTLRQAIREASDQILIAARSSPEQYGMGATCACALLIGDQLYTASVGDSRIYLIRGETIRQLTFDHTWIQEALEAGLITPDQVEGHPNAHVIRRYLGSPHPPEVDFRMRLGADETRQEAEDNQGTRLLPEDHLLLCSDGLTDLVEDFEILQVFHENPFQEVGQVLSDLANDRGGHDNITLIAIEVTQLEKPPSAALKFSKILLAVAGLTAAAALIAAGVFGWMWLQDQPRPQPTATLPPRVETLTPTTTSTAAAPEIFPDAPLSTPLPQPAASETPLPELDNAATLTPWPTNTLAPPPN